MNVLGIIPARYNSTRFPGKPLVNISGKTMLERTYEQASKCSALSELIIATDDEKIMQEAERIGAEAVFTSSKHKNGTERCWEAYQKWDKTYDVVLNIQGDEPFLAPDTINEVLESFYDPDTEIGTLVKAIENKDELTIDSVIKVVIDAYKNALYFSRGAIPFVQNEANVTFYKHIGLYAFRPEILQEIVELEPTPLEEAESLEQLRWLENGYQIKVNFTEHESNSIDTPEDLEETLKRLNLK